MTNSFENELTQEQKDLLVELKEKYARELEFTTPENPSELGMVLAYEFFKRFENQFDLVYMPRYSKGKWGAFPLSVCYLPDGHETDYTYYEGIYVNFFFEPSEMNVIVFGDGVELKFDFLLVKEAYDNDEKLGSMQLFLFDKMKYAAEMFERFEELKKEYNKV